MTSLKRGVRGLINRLGYDLRRFSPDELGIDVVTDMRRFLPDDRPLIFDVGANVGQTVEWFREEFPRSTIHSFEPSPITFTQLCAAAASLDNVHLWNFALGGADGQMTFLENARSDMSSFLPLGQAGWGTITRETTVPVRTIDHFCRDRRIDRIDILKSDTQGFDLEVLKGAEESMRANRIGLLYLEVTFTEIYKDLPPLPAIWDFLTSRGFSLVSFYRFFGQQQVAGWTDALFVHRSYLRAGPSRRATSL